MIEVGHRIRDYEIVAHLKHGGMAQLFLGRRVGAQGFARPVAIKVVHPHIASDEIVQMFLEEARLSAAIQHPNVIHVEDLGETEGTFFLAMEYLHGESLSSLLAALQRVEGTLPIEAAVWIAHGAAAGLHAAHETCDSDGRPLGVVHRDVSPQNVLVSLDGHVKLIDFGVAKIRSAAVRTETGVLKGKLAYMSPEQARGEPIDRRTDIYALGIVLWEMLTMKRLFAGPNDAVVYDRVRHPNVAPPSTVDERVPAALDDVVLRALARAPSERFATAEELADALAGTMPHAITRGAALLGRSMRQMLGERIDARKNELRARETTALLVLEDVTLVTPSTAARPQETALAVMPFRVTSTESDASMGEWLADELRDVLSRVRGLRVKARSETTANENASAFGQRLGVDVVVTGRIHRERDRVRLAVALTGVEDGYQRWSGRFDCAPDEVFDVSDRVAKSITDALGTEEVRGDARPLADPEAISLYVQLRQYAAIAGVSPRFPSELVERGLAIAPREPAMLAITAICLARETYRVDPPPGVLMRAREIAERAIDLAPQLPEPWIAIAHVRHALSEPAAGIIRALRRAIANGPSVPEAYDLLGRILVDAGLIEEAVRHIDHALWLDPNLATGIAERARLHAFARDWDAVVAMLERLRTLSPGRYVGFAMRYSLWAGRTIAVPSSADVPPQIQALVGLATEIMQTRTAREEDMQRFHAVGDAARRGSRPRRFTRQLEAEMRALIGDRDGAVRLILEAIEDGLDDVMWVDHCPVFDEVRTDPRLADAREIVRQRAAEVRRAWDEW